MARIIILLSGMLVSAMSFALPNPSSTYCVEKGGTYETRMDSQGNQDGVCMFNNDGMMSECGGWAYFRGECTAGSCARWSVEMNDCEMTMAEANCG